MAMRPARLKSRGPMRLDESFAVFKQTKIGERVTNQFRVEIQNPLNRMVFGNPTTDFTSAAFGKDQFHTDRPPQHSTRNEAHILASFGQFLKAGQVLAPRESARPYIRQTLPLCQSAR